MIILMKIKPHKWYCMKAQLQIRRGHYENTPIQIYRKFHLQKLKIFR